ncbi:MAG TPA: TIGR03960 family B12-binding radical SAM protein, partial [Candidatus Sumerlaeota bacterium]|nr:TIGR03960 family B12-binding radical SAM protein [Candidatus Sumerlaeota bacterium]
EKPGRYAAAEWNAVLHKDADPSLRMVLAFPDVYEIGMSYHGFRILYERLNRMDGWAAERVFAPWPDAEAELKRKDAPLCTLESGLPLRNCHVIGFTLQHELLYTNILTMLSLGGIPLFSRDRIAPLPLIIGGGEGAFSPEPLADFFDLFLLGDGEDALPEILSAVQTSTASNEDRPYLLKRLAGIPGVYVPSLYTPLYRENGSFKGILKNDSAAPDIIRARRYDISREPGPQRPIVPNMRIVQDRLTIELRRGCINGCRFCQAGMINRPVRERPADQVMAIARNGIAATGHEEISLLALSSADYSCLPDLLRSLREEFSPEGVSVALPSIRINACDLDMVASFESVRRTGLTLAPEAGSERLRRVINKPVDDETFLRLVEQAFSLGWQTIKLYFMVGLPTETDDDIRLTVRLIRAAEEVARRRRGRNYKINVTLSPFVPKAHTPFQWEPRAPMETIRERIEMIRREFRRGNVIIKAHNLSQSRLESVFARGDRRLSASILRAWEMGCRFDSWEDHFREDLWEKAFEQTGVRPEDYAERCFDEDDALP